jgi:hypothetical protein
MNDSVFKSLGPFRLTAVLCKQIKYFAVETFSVRLSLWWILFLFTDRIFVIIGCQWSCLSRVPVKLLSLSYNFYYVFESATSLSSGCSSDISLKFPSSGCRNHRKTSCTRTSRRWCVIMHVCETLVTFRFFLCMRSVSTAWSCLWLSREDPSGPIQSRMMAHSYMCEADK